MRKPKADTLALMLTRDILRTPMQTQYTQMAAISEKNAKELGLFIKTLSAELKSLDDDIEFIHLLNMYRSESK
ncbi:hypothetical protein [Haemophilus haemolyticus]|uniref:hypothetical protein n=1 Tax=Haemophilus haemolyticus TaxID=726 RepID=UPI000E58CA42|nr:hypothetical protein [Haemophilus haemolyticus]